MSHDKSHADQLFMEYAGMQENESDYRCECLMSHVHTDESITHALYVLQTHQLITCVQS